MSREIIPATVTPEKLEVGFYEYSQNNSGGSFDIGDDVTMYVIIEAQGTQDADRRAQDVGIYFDGCDKGMDCSCCGDRWSEKGIWREEAPDYATLEEVDDAFTRPQKESWRQKDHWAKPGQPYGIVYRLDGSKIIYRKDA